MAKQHDPILTAAEQIVGRRRQLLPRRPPGADGDTCPKCGFGGTPERPNLDGWRWVIYVSAEDAATNGILNGECLMVQCFRCGYRWHEPVASPDHAGAPQ